MQWFMCEEIKKIMIGGRHKEIQVGKNQLFSVVTPSVNIPVCFFVFRLGL